MPRDWDVYLILKRLGRLIVPESSIEPLDGKVGWTPADEAFARQAGSTTYPVPTGCAKCRGLPLAPLHGESSLLYCTQCGASGCEDRLKAQFGLVPPPKRDRPPMPTKPGKTGKKRGRPRREAA